MTAVKHNSTTGAHKMGVVHLHNKQLENYGLIYAKFKCKSSKQKKAPVPGGEGRGKSSVAQRANRVSYILWSKTTTTRRFSQANMLQLTDCTQCVRGLAFRMRAVYVLGWISMTSRSDGSQHDRQSLFWPPVPPRIPYAGAHAEHLAQ